MAVTKPSAATLPRWATGATGIAQTVEPGAGQKDDGWAVNQRPPSQWFNWLFRRVYDWLAWLNDPDALSAGTLTAATGDIVATLGNVGALAGGVLGVFVTTDGTGILHANCKENLAAAAFMPNFPGTTTANIVAGGAYWQTDAITFYASANVPSGSRIKSATVRIKDNGAAVTFKLWKSVAGTTTQLGSTQTSGTGTTDQTLTVSGLTETVADDTSYSLEVSCSAGTRIYGGTLVLDKIA